MSRLKPLSLVIMFMPITLFLLLVIYIYQRRQQFEVVFSFGPESHSPEAPDPKPEVAVATPSSGKKVDDLQKIDGIGPKTASVLNNAGITTYASIAQANVDTLANILREAGIRAPIPKTWPKQARLAATEEWDELAAYQTTLVGGREK